MEFSESVNTNVVVVVVDLVIVLCNFGILLSSSDSIGRMRLTQKGLRRGSLLTNQSCVFVKYLRLNVDFIVVIAILVSCWIVETLGVLMSKKWQQLRCVSWKNAQQSVWILGRIAVVVELVIRELLV